jgi:predicted alpha/beta hydrolase
MMPHVSIKTLRRAVASVPSSLCFSWNHLDHGERTAPFPQPLMSVPIDLVCADGVRLGAHLWPALQPICGTVIINCATGVLARYYHRYAAYLAKSGFETFTYDYRGIGASRLDNMRTCSYRWHDWGTQDFEAAIQFLKNRNPESVLMVVGHSFGGFIPRLAPSVRHIHR